MKYKTILKFIEPFQKKMTRFLSIDFNHSSVELVHMESSAKGYRILAYAFQGIPDDVGDLSKVMTGIIQSFLKDNNIQEKEVVVSISDVEFVFVQHLELPVLPKDELLGAAKWKLKGKHAPVRRVPISQKRITNQYSISMARLITTLTLTSSMT